MSQHLQCVHIYYVESGGTPLEGLSLKDICHYF